MRSERAPISFPQGEGLGEEVHRRLSGGLGIYASKSRSDFPSEEIWLDSLLALLFEEPCPLVAHTDFSAYIPSPREKEEEGARWLVCEAKQRGFQGGRPPWSQDAVREGEAVSKANVGRGKAKRIPPPKSRWGPERADQPPAATKAKGLNEPARRGLSGHGFSPKERRVKDESERIWLAGTNSRGGEFKP
jgi:hypothetical protein